ncbi:MAG: DUF2442 domain-containing protein [Candidatus Electrothrix sp. MAN1_4]|nr:DUF2442 domain-containing protein [Candidatus Electrothrix sp. MAN1_4]
MNKSHLIGKLTFTDTALLIEIDGEKKQYELNSISSSLAAASNLERMTYEISPSGYGISWPLLDEDLSVDGLLGIVHTPALETATA